MKDNLLNVWNKYNWDKSGWGNAAIKSLYSDLEELLNQTLETQALALEVKAEEALKYAGEAPGDNAVGSEQRAFGAASGFQQSADYSRAQKITE